VWEIIEEVQGRRLVLFRVVKQFSKVFR